MAVKLLGDRKVIAIEGQDAESFLNGLLTVSTVSLGRDEMVWAGLLTPQGKLMFDGLLGRDGERFLFDCPGAVADDLVKRLSMYKLRAKVEISVSPFMVGFSVERPEGELVFRDMRHEKLGYRVLTERDNLADGSDDYHQLRVTCCVPEFGDDYLGAQVFPHDIGMDLLGGVDFKKGCYVGQEVVSRMSHKTEVRKRPVAVTFESTIQPGAILPGADLSVDGKKVGTIGSVADKVAIAIVRLDKIGVGSAVDCAGVPVKLAIPDWANYQFGGQG